MYKGKCARRELTHLSLFSGIGGLDIASEAAGFKAVVPQKFYPFFAAIAKMGGHNEGLDREYEQISLFDDWILRGKGTAVETWNKVEKE